MQSKLWRYLCIGLFLALAACQSAVKTPVATQPVTKLRFTYWGSEVEKAAIEGMVAAFEKANPDIDVEPIHMPYEEYIAQISAMMLDGKTPDVGYLPGLAGACFGLRKAS